MYGVMTDSNNLYYMRARFYSPEIRRFINQDILFGGIDEGQTLNRYAFVTGQPVSKIDPFGLKELELEKVLTENEIKELFKTISEMDLAFNNPRSGCESRVHLMILKMIKMGISPSKLWAFAGMIKMGISLSKLWAFAGMKGIYVEKWKDKYPWWGFHVAPVIRGIIGGQETDVVIDPALFDKPVIVKTWLDILINEQYVTKSLPNQRPTVTYKDKTTYTYAGSYVPNNPDSTYPTDGWFFDRGTITEEALKVIECAKTDCW